MNHLEPIESAYFNWLCEKVTDNGYVNGVSYWKLLRELQNTEFVWVVEMDENRAEDGKELRHEFAVETHISDPTWLEIGCSVLEMIVAVSRRASFIDGRSPREWFWIVIENLNLHYFNDTSFTDRPVRDALDRLVWRTYDYNGRGGMFPINEPTHDQRKVEIWYQFCDYLVEHE